MGNFDNTIDNRWRPGTNLSRRQLRADEAEARADEVSIRSRELSFVPTRHKKFDPAEAQTRVLIARHHFLESLKHGERLVPLLDHWQWMSRMSSPEDKQRYLEPMIDAVRRDPVANEDKLIFLLLVCEPVRRGVSKAFMDVRDGLEPAQEGVDWRNRAEARHIRHIEKESLYDVTRTGVLEALFRYPTTAPERFFPWLRNTVAHRALDHLGDELPELEPLRHNAEEAQALQQAMHGFKELEAPRMRDRAGLRQWRLRFDMRSVFEVVDSYYSQSPVCSACRDAVDRLPRVQKDVIDALYFEGVQVRDIAAQRHVAESTVRNNHKQARENLHDDDGFFLALHALGKVRGAARAQSIKARYPNGHLPDGRRIVAIDEAA